MNNSEEILDQIKMLSLSVTEENYHARVQQGYKFLITLRDLGVEKERAYQALFQYHNRLEDGLSRDYIADILDYIVGWCSPQCRIWNMDQRKGLLQAAEEAASEK